jgi:hypothetical protein
MVVELKTYDSAVKISQTVEEEISRTKSVLGEYLRRLDEIRALAERSKKIREMVFRLAGKKEGQQSLGEMNVSGLNVVLDANPFHELTAIEEAVRCQQERLLDLQKCRESLNWMDDIGNTEGIKYLVLENDGIPKRVLLKIS